MLQKLKNLFNKIRIYFITSKNIIEEVKTSLEGIGVDLRNSGDDNLIPKTANQIEEIKKQQEAKWFTRANNLVEEFVGESPIVYSSNLHDNTIRAQDQYGYIGADKTVYDKEDYIIDDVRGIKNGLKPPEYQSNTALFLSEQETFNERFKQMQKEAKIEERKRIKRDDEELKDSLDEKEYYIDVTSLLNGVKD